MALRQILITRRLREIEAERELLNADIKSVAEKRAAWTAREAAAVAALDEITDETGAEERTAFETETQEIEAEDISLRADEDQNAAKQKELDDEAEKLGAELKTIEERAKAANTKTNTQTNTNNADKAERGDGYMSKMTPEYRAKITEYCQRDDVKNWLSKTRAMIERGVTNVSLSIPTVMLPTIRERISNYSKLMPLVTVKPIRGEGKQNIIGSAPEAVWTETTGKFNELSFKFAQIPMAGEKVAGYIPVPNPYLQDSDEDLAALVTDMLGQAIGLAIDKAILYGTGSNMPVGIVPRLVAAASPSWWGANSPAFTNLSTTHVSNQSATSVTGNALLKEMLKVLGTVRPKYNVGDETKTWVMNPATWANVKVDTLTNDSAGMLVAGLNNQMPILGGNVVELDFMPENVVVGGYFGHYLLGERHSMELRRSEHVMFTDDVTVFAGVARYDGRPIAGEAFAAFSLDATAVSGTAVTFAEDSANS